MIRPAAGLAAVCALALPLALGACDVNVQTHQLVAAPPVPGAEQRTRQAEQVSLRQVPSEQAAAAGPAQDPAALARLVNDYRARNGLPPVPLSPLLTRVAQAHLQEMEAQPRGGLAVFEQTDPQTGLECGPHSWPKGGKWMPVCYTGDGRQTLAMYAKPREITGGAYDADGVEAAAWDTHAITPAVAIDTLQNSRSESEVVLERHNWRDAHWQAMGVAIGGHFAYIWFGKAPDPAAAPQS